MPDTSRAFQRSLTAAALFALLSHAAPALPQEASPPEGPPYRIGGEVTRPEIVLKESPLYTPLAREHHVHGVVMLKVVVDEQGNVTDTQVIKGLPLGLDQAAVEAVKNWKFKPATLKGRAVPVYYEVAVNFQTTDSSFGYGPLFAKFVDQNRDFALHLYHKRYKEASEILDRQARERPDDPVIPLARIRVLLHQGLLWEGWRAALKLRDPERYESLNSVGGYALHQAYDETLDEESRTRAIELGLQAVAAAMETKADGFDALSIKSSLLVAESMLALDPRESKALQEEAHRLRKQSVEIQKTRGTGAAPLQDRP